MRVDNKIIGSILIILIVVALLLIWWFGRNEETMQEKKKFKNLSDEFIVEDQKVIQYGKSIKDDEQTYKIMHAFIKERLPQQDIFLEFDLEKDAQKPLTLTDLRDELFDKLYMAIKEKDLDNFTFVFSGEAVKELWGDKTDPEERIQLLKEALSKLNRQGSFQTIRYQMEQDEEDHITDEGIFFIEYDDDYEVAVPFTISLIGDQEEGYFQFDNSVQEIIKHIGK